MKKVLLLLLIIVNSALSNAQSKGVKIGYIDMDYILENVPDYKEASIQLDVKADKWKQDIESRKNEITKLKDVLKTERTLLTKELIEEREEEIKFQEKELFDYQQKRFGSAGDLMIQKASIVKPVQDQIFTAVQDIAEAKKYDFIFDKSSDMTMLFSAKRYDISDQIIRTITRSEKREEMSKKQLKSLEEKEAKEDGDEPNLAQEERKKIIEEKKATRDKTLLERKLATDQKRKEALEARKKPNTEKTGTAIDSTSNKTSNDGLKGIEEAKTSQDSIKSEKEEARLKTVEENKKNIEARQKALEERRKKILADREAAKKVAEEKKKKTE